MTTKIDTGTTIAIVFVELSPNLPFAVVSTSDSVVPPTFDGIVVPPTFDSIVVPPTFDGIVVPPTFDGIVVPPTFDGIVVPPTFDGIVICVFKLVFVGGGIFGVVGVNASDVFFFYNFICSLPLSKFHGKQGYREVENVSNDLIGDYIPNYKHKNIIRTKKTS